MIRRTAFAMILAALAASCGSEPPSTEAYVAGVLAERAEKDRAFGESSDSPVPVERRKMLLPLSYFPPDPDYRVAAMLRVAEDQPAAEMPTSTGKIRAMRRVGLLEFSLKGQPLTLAAFADAEARTVDRLFVPFSDLSSGTESYAAGRYIDLDRTATGIYDLDFNRAYHPYCYFDERYDCPFPPPENRLPVPVRAGERLPADSRLDSRNSPSR